MAVMNDAIGFNMSSSNFINTTAAVSGVRHDVQLGGG